LFKFLAGDLHLPSTLFDQFSSKLHQDTIEITDRTQFAVVYSCFGIFIVFLSKCNVNFTSPLEDDFSGEGQLSGSSIFHDKT